MEVGCPEDEPKRAVVIVTVVWFTKPRATKDYDRLDQDHMETHSTRITGFARSDGVTWVLSLSYSR